MSVLDSIIEGVREDLASRRVSLNQLLEQVESAPPLIPVNFPITQTSVIAEVKRKSPSKGDLAKIPEPAKLAASYQEAGAAAVSVLTRSEEHTSELQSH